MNQSDIHITRVKWIDKINEILKETKIFAISLEKAIGDISPMEADIGLIKFFAEKLGKDYD